jgi:hypothetical protein
LKSTYIFSNHNPMSTMNKVVYNIIMYIIYITTRKFKQRWLYNMYVYVIWMWIDWYRKYQSAKPEYEVCWWVSETNESQTSYSVEQADIFQYQSYSHSDDIFIILKSIINTDTSIFVFSREKLHDSIYSKYTSLKP